MRTWTLLKDYGHHWLWTNGIYKESFFPGEDPNVTLVNMEMTPNGRKVKRGI